MKVLLIFLGRKGGGSIYTYELVKALSNEIDITVILSGFIENKLEWEKLNVNTYFVNTYRNLFEALLSIFMINRLIYLFKIVKIENPEVVHYTMNHPWIPLLNILFFRRKKIIMTIHDPIQHKGRENFVLLLIQKISIKQADRIVILSKVFKNKIGIDPESIDVIPHGEFSYYKSSKQETVNGKIYDVIFFGRICENKGLDVLLKAFKLLLEFKPNAKLIVVGSGNILPYKDLIEQVNDNIHLVNRWVQENEVEGFFNMAKILAIPYIDASQSGVIPLGYAMGLPVVASNTGGLSEQVINNKTGYLVEPGDHQELAGRLATLISNDELYNDMRSNIKKFISSKMSWGEISEKYVACYESVLSS